MKLVLWPGVGGAEMEARLRAIAGAEISLARDVDELAAAIPVAQVLVIGGHLFSAAVAAALRTHAKKLRLIQSYTAGYEGMQAHGVPPGVLFANAGDAWSPGVAEHGMALLLALTKCLPHYIANQPRHVWDRGAARRMGSLIGQTLVIVGFGSIGREFAARARAFGMTILGVSRSARPDPLADEIHPASALAQVLGRADVVLIAVPYSPATDKMMGAAQFSACKRGAVLVNLARGGLVDAVALGAALKSGQLGGAATDVTEPEPLAADDPLWDAPNLLLTPHVAGASGPRGLTRLAEIVSANVARFVAGEPLQHLVKL